MPRKTNTVMSIVPWTWRNSESPPGTSDPPPRLPTKTSQSRKKTTRTRKSASGTSFATVTMKLIPAASLTPRRIRRKNPQTAATDRMNAGHVSPCPSTGSRSGKSCERVVMMSTQ